MVDLLFKYAFQKKFNQNLRFSGNHSLMNIFVCIFSDNYIEFGNGCRGATNPAYTASIDIPSAECFYCGSIHCDMHTKREIINVRIDQSSAHTSQGNGTILKICISSFQICFKKQSIKYDKLFLFHGWLLLVIYISKLSSLDGEVSQKIFFCRKLIFQKNCVMRHRQ